MAIIYMNIHGSLSSGGPTVAAARIAQGLEKRGHKVIYEKPNRSDVCLCIIESGKILKSINRQKTKVVVRLDGIYLKGYWHGGEGRKWRPDMTALHAAVKRDIEQVDHIVYQSSFSKKMVDSEILERKEKFSVINNGIDTNIYTFKNRKKDGFINLFHHGVIRNDYIMNSLIGCYKNLKNKGISVRLIIVGGMDAECRNIFNKHSGDSGIKYLGPVPNSKLPQMFENACIGVYPRQGSSSDNSVIECLSSGIPVVIPSFGGNIEFINNGVEGVVVDSNNWDYGVDYTKRLSDAVEKIIPKLDEFKLNARKHAIKNLSINVMMEKYIKAMGM